MKSLDLIIPQSTSIPLALRGLKNHPLKRLERRRFEPFRDGNLFLHTLWVRYVALEPTRSSSFIILPVPLPAPFSILLHLLIRHIGVVLSTWIFGEAHVIKMPSDPIRRIRELGGNKLLNNICILGVKVLDVGVLVAVA